MDKLLVLVLLLVVMGNSPARGDQMADHLDNHPDGSNVQTASSSHNNIPGDNGPRQLELTMLRPSNVDDLARAFATRMVNRDGDDEDHSNIELDKLAIYQYDMLPAIPVQGGNNLDRPSAGDAYSLSRFLSKMTGSKRAAQWDRKLRDPLTGSMEDKDYSFVGSPVTNFRYNGLQQQQQRRDSKLPVQMLRDMIMSNEKAMRFASDHNNSDKPEQLLQAVRLGPLVSYMDQTRDSIPRSYREKRRRCNVGQSNMGVKNPSFCDTDAYFGAADYSMRDVWDSAGRR